MNEIKNLWEYKLEMKSHIYWDSKEKFDLSEDTYSNWVLFCLESGSFQYEIKGEEGIVKSNELVFCPPNYTISRKALSSMAIHFITFDIQPPTTNVNIIKQMSSFKISPTDKMRLNSNFSYLKRLNFSLNLQSVQRKEWMLNDLWWLACNEWDYIPKEIDLAGFSQTEDLLMNTAMNKLIKVANTQFKIKDISDSIGLSQVQFTRRFKKVYNIFPSEVVRTVRLRAVINLLLNTDMTLDEIAEYCGFNNGFYLSRVFKENMGVTPSLFRKQNKL